MLRYYFDVDDGEKSFVDDEGSDLPDANAARDEALSTKFGNGTLLALDFE